MNNEKEKLKRALSDYQQARRDEIERARRSELERQAQMERWFDRLAVFGCTIGVIAGIYFGWVYILDFSLRLIASFLAVMVVMLILQVVTLGKLPPTIVGLLATVLMLYYMIGSYIPSSDIYRALPVWENW